jgi:hypothetical protein
MLKSEVENKTRNITQQEGIHTYTRGEPINAESTFLTHIF